MPDNIQETSENPLKLPKTHIKPAQKYNFHEVQENLDYATQLDKEGGMGGKGIDVPDYMRKQQSEFEKLPKDINPPKNISKN